MANQANFHVNNCFRNDITVSSKISRGPIDKKLTIKPKSKYPIFIPGPEVSLRIDAPKGVDAGECYLKLKSQVDLSVKYSKNKAQWVIRLTPNKLADNLPTTVNVEVGVDKPGKS